MASKNNKNTPPAPPVNGEGQERVAPKAAAPKYIVVQTFRDIQSFSTVYAEGADVSHLDAQRLESLIEKGLVQPSNKPA